MKRTQSLPRERLASDIARDRISLLGPITAADSPETKRKKLEAFFELSDALAAEGMELWSSSRIEQEIASSRGLND